MQQFTSSQLVHAGNIVYDEDRKKKQKRYQKAIERASFLNEREKRNWGLLGHMLSKQQLKEAEKLIINEDLRLLQLRQKLEKIKPTKDKKNG